MFLKINLTPKRQNKLTERSSAVNFVAPVDAAALCAALDLDAKTEPWRKLMCRLSTSLGSSVTLGALCS
jgi:hypothetical protein